MKIRIRKHVSAIALICTIMPTQVFCEEDAEAKQRPVTDIALSAAGGFQGICITVDGRPVSGQHVSVMYQGHTIATAKTDSNGRYRIRDLRSGVHVVRVGETQKLCRFWDAKAATPAAKKGLVSITNNQLVRGQCPPSRFSTGEMIGAMAFTGVAAVTLASTVDSSSSAASGAAAAGNPLGLHQLGNLVFPASP